ncbi:MAG: MFS transporter [Thermomicrobiales bacterium]|nr:MFS transporter [Thermomicrobiales bacterium]
MPEARAAKQTWATPRVYYGWVIAGVLAVTETISFGVLFYAFSALLVPMERELGWSKATLNGGFSLAILVSGLAAVPVGRLVDRRGPRAPMTLGSLTGVVLVLAWARVSSVGGYFLIWTGIGLAMALTLYEPAFTTVAVWFRRLRMRALLVVTTVAGFASTIFLPLTTWLTDERGWRAALVVLAVILAVGTVPLHALLLRRRPADLGLHPDGDPPPPDPLPGGVAAPAAPGATLRQALRDPGFWRLGIAFWLATLVSIALGVHLIPLLVERGESPAFAAAAVGAIGAAQVLARVAVAALGDRVSLAVASAIVFALQGVATLLLLIPDHRSAIVVGVLLLGAGRGATTLIRADIVAARYGAAHYGAIGGALTLLLVGARAAAPVGIGALAMGMGGYNPVLWALGGAAALSALLIAGLPEANPSQWGAAREQRVGRPA